MPVSRLLPLIVRPSADNIRAHPAIESLGLNPRGSSRAKRLSLRVNPRTGRIDLVIPDRTPERHVLRFVEEHKQWIAARQAVLTPPGRIENGTVILYRGHPLTVRICRHSKRQTEISTSETDLIIQTRRDDVTSNVKNWLRQQAEARMRPLVHAMAGDIGAKPSRIDFRDTSSRWGSCSSDGRIMLSWRLIMAPDSVADYVIAHEIAHLRHMNHGPAFWDLCRRLSPQTDRARQWLDQNGQNLLAFF